MPEDTMGIDWDLLARLRERQKALVQQRVAEERRMLARREARVRDAQAERDARQSEKAGLHRSVQGHRPVPIEQMRLAGAWSGVLDARIATACEEIDAARADAALQGERVQACRRELRAAAGELQKAQRMQQDQARARSRLDEARLEDAGEETALQVWRARQARA